MADVNSNIFINIDTAQAMSALRGLDKQLSAFNRSMIVGTKAAQAAQADFTRSLLHNVNATGAFTGSMTKMSTATDQFTERLEKGRLSLREYYRYGMASTRTFGRLFGREFETVGNLVERRVKTLQTQYVGLGRDAQGAINAMSMTPKKLNYNDQLTRMQMVIQRQQILNKLLADGSVKLLNFGKNTQWAGRQLMVGFTIPLAMFAASAVKSFKEIETQALRFKKVYGELFTTQDETEAALRNMQKLADEYTKYGLKVAETIKTASEAAAAGFAGNDLDVIVRQANKLAVLGGVAQDQSLETIIALKNAFGITTAELGKNIDFLNAVENQTVLTIEDLTKAIPRVAPVIKQLGGDVKDLSFFLTAMKEGGVSAEQGANALKSGLASLINPSTAAIKATSALGINLKAIVETNAGDLKQTVLEFAQSISTLNDLQRGQVIEKIFGKYQFARLSAMFNNITKEGTQANRVMRLSVATAEELAILSQREMKLSESSAMNKMQAQIEKLKAAIAPVGELFAKVLTPVIEFFVKLFDKFNQLPDGVKKAVALIVAGIAGIGPVVLMTVGLVANGIANLMKMFNLVRQGYQRLAYGSKDAALSTRYMSQEELQNTAVTNSLTTSHQNLSSAYVLEASSLRALTAVYQQANAAMSSFARNNPGMFMPGLPRGGGVPPRRYNKGVSYVPGTGNTDTVAAMLTPGEAVIPKPMVAKYGGLVDAMVKDQVPGYAFGPGRFAPTSAPVIGSLGSFGAAGAIGSSIAARRLTTIQLSPNAISSRVMQRVALEEQGDLISVTMGGAQFFVKKSKYKDLESIILQNEKYQTSKGASVDDILATMVSRVSAPHRNLLGATVSPSRIKAILPLNPTTSAVSRDAKSRRLAYKDKQAYLDLQAYYKQEEAYVRQRLSLDDIVALTAPRAKFEGERLKDVISRTGDKGLFSLSSALSHGIPAKGKIRNADQDRASNLYEETNQMNLAYAYNKNRPHVKSEAEARAFMNELIEKKNKTAFDRYAIAALDKRIRDRFYDRFKTRQDELLMANKGVLTPGGSYGNIPAMLTPGEAVLSKDVVKKYQPLISAMSEGDIPGYFGGVMLGMPMSFAKTQQMRASQAQLEAAVAKSRLAKTAPTDFGHLVQPFSGRSFPIPGVGGVYRKPNGELVVVKPAVDEKSALAEIRATQIAREAHGLDSPKQSLRTMIDPSDPTGKRKLIVLESPYNKKFAEPTGKFTKQEYIKQLVAASLRGDKDLSMSNLSGNMLADVGTAGVFSKASGFRDFAKSMPSMEDQAVVNLLGVKGGAKRFFAEATSPIASKMTAQEFESMMLAEISRVLPKLKKTISSFKLNKEESAVYADMIARLEAGKKADWKKIHGIHTNVKPKKYKTGVVSVPGPKGAGDIMPAMLAPGEAVIPAKMTEKYSPLISGMINDSIPGFGTGPGFFDPNDPWDDGSRRTLLGPDGRPLPPSSPILDTSKAETRIDRFGKKWNKFVSKFEKAGPPIDKVGTAMGDTTKAFEKDKTRGFTGWLTGYGRVSDTVQNEDGSTRKATQAERTNMRMDKRMMASQRGMGIGMAAMMVPMAAGAYAQKNPDSGIAKNMDMIMMVSMLVMLLPMLNSPLKLLIGTVAGLGIVYKMQAAAIKKSMLEGEKQGKSMVMATSRLEELGKITGTVSKTQIAAERRKARNTDISPVSIEFGNKVIGESDFGKNLKTSFEQSIADFGESVAVDSLANQLGTAVSQGLLNADQAESIAVALTRNLKDAKLELNVRGRLIQLLGPNGENLVSNPLAVEVELIASGQRVQKAATDKLNKVANQEVGINTKGEIFQTIGATVGGGLIAAKAGMSAANMVSDVSAARAGGGVMKGIQALSAARKAGTVASLGVAAAGAPVGGVGAIPGLVGAAVSTVVLGGIEAGLRNWQKGKEKALMAKAAGVVQGITSQNLAASQGSVDALTSQYDTAIANLELKKKTLKTEQERAIVDEQILVLQGKKDTGLKTLRRTQADILGSVVTNYESVNKRSLMETLSPFGSGRGQVRDKYMEAFSVGMQEKFKDNPALKAQAQVLQGELDSIGNDAVTLEISTLVTSDVLTPNEASVMLKNLTAVGGDVSKNLKAIVSVQGPEGLQRLSTLLTLIPDENNQKQLVLAVKQMNKTEADATFSAIEELGKIPDFVGIDLNIETQQNDIADLKQTGKEIDAIKKKFPNGQVDLKALIKMQEEAGGAGKNLTLDAAIAQWSTISKLDKNVQLQAIITIGSITKSDSFDKIMDRELASEFYKQNPKLAFSFVDPKQEAAKNAKLKAFKEDAKNIELVSKKILGDLATQIFPTATPPIVPPKGGGASETGTKKDTSWLNDLTQRLKIVKDSSIDALNPLASIKKFLGKDIAGLGGGSVKSNKSLNEQLGAIQEIDALAQNKNIRGLSDDFREILVNMDPEQFALWAKTLFTVGKDKRISGLTQDFIDINSAFRTATIGEYIENETKAVEEVRNRVSVYYTLIDLAKEYGFSVADTNKLLQNQSLVTDIASGMQYSKTELAELIEINGQARKELSKETTTKQLQDNNKIQIQIDAFKKLKDAGVEYETILQIISKSEWAEAVASSTGKIADEFSDLIKSAKDYKKLVFDLSQLNETDATKLDQKFAAEAARIAAESSAEFRKTNKMSIEQFNTITREKEIAQRDFQDQIDLYNDGISEIEKLEQSVNEKYDAKNKLIDDQVSALESVFSINEDIAAQQQSQLTLADAITQGDISAAAKAAEDYSAQQAEIASRNASEALDKQRAAMDIARQKEIDKQTTIINGKTYTKKELTKEINRIQEKSIAPLEKEIEQRNRLVSAHEDANTKALANVEINKMTASEWDAIKNAANALNEAYDAQVIDIDEIATSVLGVSTAWDTVAQSVKDASLQVGKYPGFMTGPDKPNKDASIELENTKAELAAVAKAKLKSDIGGDTRQERIAAFRSKYPFAINMPDSVVATLAGFAKGGFVPSTFESGGYAQGTDTVPAMLTPGEYVLKKSAVDKYGVDQLDAMNVGYYGFGGLVKSISKSSILKNVPRAGLSGGIYQAMEELEKTLSLKYGSNRSSSKVAKWSTALGRAAFNTLQQGLSGLPFAGVGGLIGVGTGLIDGVASLIREGSDYGLKGGKYANKQGSKAVHRGFDPKKELDNMSIGQSAKNVGKSVGYGALFGLGGNAVAAGFKKFLPTILQSNLMTKASSMLPKINSFTLPKLVSSIKQKTGIELSPWEKAAKIASEQAQVGGFTPIESLLGAKHSTLLGELQALTPQSGTFVAPKSGIQYAYEFVPADPTKFPAESTLLQGIKNYAENPMGYSEKLGPQHIIKVTEIGTGRKVASLEWDSVTGSIAGAYTQGSWQGQGIMRWLNEHAASFSRLKHSSSRTDEGRGYSAAVGGIMPDKQIIDQPLPLNLAILETLKTSGLDSIFEGGIRQAAPTKFPVGPRAPYVAATGPGADLWNTHYPHPDIKAWRTDPNRTYSNYPYFQNEGSYVDPADFEELIRLQARDLIRLQDLPAAPARKTGSRDMLEFRAKGGLIPSYFANGGEVPGPPTTGRFLESPYDTAKREYQEQNKKTIKISIPPIRANFNTNSFKLNKKQKQELDSLAKQIAKYKLKSLVVQGHADSRGGVDNDLLSLNRAKATANYLSNLIPNTSFVPVGHGVYKPLVPNTSPENMAQNRRAEVFLPNTYKTIYPDYKPKNHIREIIGGGSILPTDGALSGGTMLSNNGTLIGGTMDPLGSMSSGIDFGKLFSKLGSLLGKGDRDPKNTRGAGGSGHVLLKSKGGLIPSYFAAGGYAKGTDTVPAMLTPGEFIIKKSVADQYRSLLESLNNGTYKSFEAPIYSSMNSNVKVGAGTTGSSADNSSKVYNYNVGISVNNTNAGADDIAKAVMSEIKYIDSQRLRGQR